jgi:hypothetical protein
MKYVCLVYGEERRLQALAPHEMAAIDAASMAYDRSLEESGHLIVAQALHSVAKSKKVRKRKGKVTITDGPFAETKEQLLGFLMIEAESLEVALAIAAEVPLAEIGTVEVRQIYKVPGS